MSSINEITDKLKFFREIQLYPKPKELDFENWLENFQDLGEREMK